MNKIKKYALSDLYEMSSGISTTKEQAGHGSPFVSFGTVFNNYFLPDILPDLMNTSEKEQETYSIKEGDILLTRTSETIDELAMSCVALKDYPKATYSGFTKRLRPKTKGIAYHKYLAFYLRGYIFRKAVTNNAFMTLRASFNEDIFSLLNLYLPSYEEQVKIGDLLYRMEQKIQLNNRLIAELEEMAKTIFDYWFVQFDFPNSEGKPYRSSGGEMVWNERLKREIPKGWEVKNLEDFIKVIRGVTYSKGDVSDVPKDGYTTLLRANNISNGTINYDSLVYVKDDYISDNQMLSERSIFIAMSSGSKEHVGKTAIVPCNLNTAFGAFCSKIKIVENAFAWLMIYFRTEYFKTYINNICLGTNINNLTNEHIGSIKIPVPPQSVLDKYNNLINPLINKQGNSHIESQELIKLRGWLLPMLMNGQVKFKSINNIKENYLDTEQVAETQSKYGED